MRDLGLHGPHLKGKSFDIGILHVFRIIKSLSQITLKERWIFIILALSFTCSMRRRPVAAWPALLWSSSQLLSPCYHRCHGLLTMMQVTLAGWGSGSGMNCWFILHGKRIWPNKICIKLWQFGFILILFSISLGFLPLHFCVLYFSCLISGWALFRWTKLGDGWWWIIYLETLEGIHDHFLGFLLWEWK